MPSLVQKVSVYIRKKMYSNASGSDWYHVERVLSLARRIQKVEGGDLELIEMSVLLHDFRSYKEQNFDEKKGMLALSGMMAILEIPDEMQQSIHDIIVDSQYLGEETKTPKTLEGKIVQDADWLDALGAIGIARTFAAGGHINRMMHDPHKKPRKFLNKNDYLYKKTDSTSLNYFYEKLFKLTKLMNTTTAKAIAQKREQFIRLYIEEFLAEWTGKK